MKDAENTKKVLAAREMITVRVSGQDVCVDVMSVREIRVWVPATPLAHAPSFVVGVINLRGAVLPIIDFALRLGFAPTEPSSRHAILVVEVGKQAAGLLVEEVSEIVTITPDMIQPAPELYTRTAPATIDGIVAMNGRLISLVALAAIVPHEIPLAA
jgi:purine-binding chemotaxis protein CheW